MSTAGRDKMLSPFLHNSGESRSQRIQAWQVEEQGSSNAKARLQRMGLQPIGRLPVQGMPA